MRPGGDDAPLLKTDELTTRELSAGETHLYQVALDAGQYFHALVKPQGVEAVVILATPGGQTLVRLDCRRRGPTPVSFIAEESGRYRLEVRAGEERDSRGWYELRIAEVRPAAPRDKYRVAAEGAFAEGERLLKDGEAGQSRLAIGKYEESLSSWRSYGDHRQEANALRRIGDIHSSLGEYEAALSYYNRALSSSRGANDRRGEGESLNGITYVYLTLGQNQKALSYCARALKLSRATNDRRTEAQAITDIGEIQYGLGRLQRSIDFYQQALPLWRELDDREGQALAFLNLGYTYSDLGNVREAFDSYNQALALWQAVRGRRGEGVTLIAIGRLYSRIGESQEALNFFERAEPLIQRAGNPIEEARLLTGMAFVYNWIGEKQRALDYYERALSLFRAARYPNGEASALSSAGRAYYSIGDIRKALEYHHRALSIFKAISDRRMEFIQVKEIGRLYESQGDKAGALKNYSLARSFERAEKDLRGEADTLNLMGRVYEDQGGRRRALECYGRALALSREAEHLFGETAALYNLARFERGRGGLEAARAHAEEALRLVESLRTKVASQDLRASYFASVRQLYELYVDLLMESHRRHPGGGYDAAAFEASERARARSLLETLAAARVSVREKVEPELLARERALRDELSAKAERRMTVADGASESERAAVAREMDELRVRYQEVVAQVRAAGLEHTEQSQPRPLGLQEIRDRGLDGDTLLLEFFLGEERSYLWLVAKDSLRSYELPARALIEETAHRVRSLLTAPAQAEGESPSQWRARLKESEGRYWQEARTLSALLLGPAAGSLGTKRLLVVADGALQYVPFNALPVPGRDGGDPVPLIVEHEITSQPSASVLATLRGAGVGRPSPAKAVAVIADPVFEADDTRLAGGREGPAGVAPPSRSTTSRGALRDVSPAWAGGNIPRLVGSRAEAEAIMSVAAGTDNLRAVGFDADKATVTAPALGHYRIIHFATHGLLDSEHPEMSGLLLSRFDSSGRPKEGLLRLDDIYNLTLPADLVVLSACDTGLGKDVKGEGLVGLVRGFMHAGSPRVVASLWKVDDEATAELMTSFYREMLQAGRSPAGALREAQVSMWRQRRWRAPYYWAAFVMQGEYGGQIDAGRGRVRHWVWQLGAASLLGALCYLYAWRRRARRKRHEH